MPAALATTAIHGDYRIAAAGPSDAAGAGDPGRNG
jgi:hypothetical protein